MGWVHPGEGGVTLERKPSLWERSFNWTPDGATIVAAFRRHGAGVGRDERRLHKGGGRSARGGWQCVL